MRTTNQAISGTSHVPHVPQVCFVGDVRGVRSLRNRWDLVPHVWFPVVRSRHPHCVAVCRFERGNLGQNGTSGRKWDRPQNAQGAAIVAVLLGWPHWPRWPHSEKGGRARASLRAGAGARARA